MDISPKLLREVEFREQWRGYNPEEVDEFLERLALGLEELQQRLADALERASNAERRLLERNDEDEIRRTLVLAQRTAVASMDEARAEAERLVQETEERCRSLVADAEAQSAQLEADIAERRRTELGDLAEQRAALQVDIEELRRFTDEQRSTLQAALRSQLEWLDTSMVVGASPPVADIAPVPADPDRAAGESQVAAVDDDADPLVAELLEVPGIPEEPFVVDAEPDAEPAPDVDELAEARAELAAALARAGAEPDDLPGDPPTVFDDDATGHYDVLAEAPAPAAADADPEAPAWRDDDDDPFLAELRKAVADTGPLGPRDDDPPPAPVHHDRDDGDDGSSAGFFRRGRRRG